MNLFQRSGWRPCGPTAASERPRRPTGRHVPEERRYRGPGRASILPGFPGDARGERQPGPPPAPRMQQCLKVLWPDREDHWTCGQPFSTTAWIPGTAGSSIACPLSGRERSRARARTRLILSGEKRTSRPQLPGGAGRGDRDLPSSRHRSGAHPHRRSIEPPGLRSPGGSRPGVSQVLYRPGLTVERTSPGGVLRPGLRPSGPCPQETSRPKGSAGRRHRPCSSSDRDEEGRRWAASSMHFAPPERVTWRASISTSSPGARSRSSCQANHKKFSCDKNRLPAQTERGGDGMKRTADLTGSTGRQSSHPELPVLRLDPGFGSALSSIKREHRPFPAGQPEEMGFGSWTTSARAHPVTPKLNGRKSTPVPCAQRVPVFRSGCCRRSPRRWPAETALREEALHLLLAAANVELGVHHGVQLGSRHAEGRVRRQTVQEVAGLSPPSSGRWRPWSGPGCARGAPGGCRPASRPPS